MRIIKKLDQYIFKNFITLFAGTFCISLFAVMMQFLWKYVDELVGKGLGQKHWFRQHSRWPCCLLP